MTISGVEYLPDGRILIKTNIPSVLNFSDEVVTVYGAVQAGIESERELGFIEEADLVREPGTYTEYILRETDTSKLKWVPRAGDLVYVEFRSPPIKNDYLARTYLTHIKFTTNYKYGVLSLALLMSSDYPTYRKYIFDGFDFMIEEVTEFVSELSDTLDQGLFAGMDMTGAFRNTDHEEINHLLRFVHERPFNYMSKSWKFSETYATWVLNKTPLSRAHYRDVLLDMDEKERSERLPYFEEQIANHLNDWFTL